MPGLGDGRQGNVNRAQLNPAVTQRASVCSSPPLQPQMVTRRVYKVLGYPQIAPDFRLITEQLSLAPPRSCATPYTPRDLLVMDCPHLVSYLRTLPLEDSAPLCYACSSVTFVR